MKKPTRVAVLPVGYQHGLTIDCPRSMSFWKIWRRWRKLCKLTVTISGQRARVIGQIGATETVIDITNLKCSAGDIASFEIDPMFARGFTVEYR